MATAASEPAKLEATLPPSETAKTGSRRKLILIAAVLLVAVIAAGLWFTGVLPQMLGLNHAERRTETAEAHVPIYVDLPEMVANLNSNPRRTNYVKLQARLEVAKQDDVEPIKAAMPRLLDLFQTYLREMRPEELRGSGGTYRLREELIGRANIAVAPVHVVNVLFTQLLVQ